MVSGNGAEDAPRHAAPAGAARARRPFPRYRRSKARFEGRPDSATGPVPSESPRPVKAIESAVTVAPENAPKPAAPETKSDENIQPIHVTPMKSKVLMFETGAPSEVQTPQKNQKVLAEVNANVSNLKIAAGSATKNTWVPEKASTPPAGSAVRSQEPAVDPGIAKAARAMVTFDEKADSLTPRPLVCLDINNSGEDMLYLSGIPSGMTYDSLFELVEPFGEVEALNWSSKDPHVCEVIYKDHSSLTEAIHYLDNAIVGGEKEPPLKAKLRSREPGAQLFVGDLTPDVTEAMLEEKFMEIVGSRVTAVLKRDPESFSPIGYGFLSFQSETDANRALLSGHRAKVGNACIRVGRAERNTHLYVPDLNPNVTMEELKDVFAKFGNIIEEDTVIVRRSYAFIRYKDRLSAERAKRTLDKTDLQGRITVRYAEAEPLKACISVQFHSSYPKAPGSIRELLIATFSKYGNCSVEIPRLRNGQWRKVAFVTFHGDQISATLAATEAVQSVRFVSTVPVCCQFARELIPRIPPRDLRAERGRAQNTRVSGAEAMVNSRLRVQPQGPGRAPSIRPSTVHPPAEPGVMGMTAMPRAHGQPHGDLVPVYVPMSALHPLSIQHGQVAMPEGDYAAPVNWENRVFNPMDGGNQQQMHHSNGNFGAGPSGAGPQERQW